MKKTFLALALPIALFANNTKTIDVYEDPDCGCCQLWSKYMMTKGYNVNVFKTKKYMDIKNEYKIDPKYQSCHTGLIDGYAIEGHVPEDAVVWLLENKPKDVIGISAPGMPQGSPGMEQGQFEDYPVILMMKDGSYKMYAIYRGKTVVKKF